MKMIAGPIAAVELEMYGVAQRGERSAEEAMKLPAMEEFLREPMKGFGLEELIEGTVGWRKMTGEAFWVLPDSANGFYAPGVAFHVVLARPDRMRHVVTNGVLEGWEFTDGAGRRHALLPEQVIHSKMWNPYDDFRGLGDYEAAHLAAEGDWLGAKFARNVMANNGDTGPYIVAKNGIPSGEQREQILMDLRAKRAAQARGDFRPVFMTGDITVEDPQIKSVDAAYIAGRVENRHEIAVALGVPPSLFDIKAAYSIGSASDNFQLVTNTCMPEGKRFCRMIDVLALRMTGERVESELCWDEHPVMQEVRRERMANVDGLWSKGVPMAVIDEYLGLGLPDYAGKDVAYLPFSVSPVGEAVMPITSQDLAEPDAVVQDALRALRTGGGTQGTAACVCGCSLDGADLDVRGRDPKEVAQWKEIVSARLPIIKAYRTRIDQALMKARRDVLSKIEAKRGMKAAAADFMFSLADFGAELTASMRSVSIEAVKAAGNQVFKEVGKDDPWSMPSADTMHFLKQRENKLSGVPNDIWNQVSDAITAQIDGGGTMDEIARDVKAVFNKISDGRARTIAQTETAAAYGFGRQKGLEDAGIKWKRWLTSGNSNVRSAHRMINGAIVAVDGTFMVIDPKTGDVDHVTGPGDPNGAAWNVINCHCVAVATMEKA